MFITSVTPDTVFPETSVILTVRGQRLIGSSASLGDVPVFLNTTGPESRAAKSSTGNGEPIMRKAVGDDDEEVYIALPRALPRCQYYSLTVVADSGESAVRKEAVFLTPLRCGEGTFIAGISYDVITSATSCSGEAACRACPVGGRFRLVVYLLYLMCEYVCGG